jgi:hypothetical protein
MLVYGTSGFCCAATGLCLAARFGVGQPYTGVNYTLASITPVVLGGTLLSGGKGGVVGTLFGAFLIALLNNLLNFMDVSNHYQLVAHAVIIDPALGRYAPAGGGMNIVDDRQGRRPAGTERWLKSGFLDAERILPLYLRDPDGAIPMVRRVAIRQRDDGISPLREEYSNTSESEGKIIDAKVRPRDKRALNVNGGSPTEALWLMSHRAIRFVATASLSEPSGHHLEYAA